MKKRVFFTSLLAALLILAGSLLPSLEAHAAGPLGAAAGSAVSNSAASSETFDGTQSAGEVSSPPAAEGAQTTPEDTTQGASSEDSGPAENTSSSEESTIPEDSQSESSPSESQSGEAGETGEADASAGSSSAEQESSSSADTGESAPESEENLSDEELEEAPVAGLRQLDAATVEVATYAALKAAIEGNNGYTTILFAGDITQDSATGNVKITVNANKAALTLDGQGFTFTQLASTSIDRTIAVETGNTVTRDVTVANMTYVGGNYYGIVAVREAVTGVTLTLQNVQYSGPQAIYNRAGSLTITDSNFALNNRGAAAAEVSEAANVVLGGSITVTKGNTSDSVFWLPGLATSFTLLPGAQVSVDTAHYFIFAGGSRPVVTLGEGASLTVNQVNGMTWDTQMLDTLTLEKDAAMTVTQTGERGFSGLYIATSLTVGEGASFEYVKTSGSNPAVHFTQSGAAASFANPRRVALYSSVGLPLRFTGGGTLKVTAGTYNRWAAAPGTSPAGLDQLPGFYWNRAGSDLLEMTASYNASSVTGVVHNLAASDPVPAGSPLTAANLTGSTQLITFGAVPFAPAVPYTHHTALGGSALAGSWLEATLPSGSALKGQAGGDGSYALPLGGETLAQGETVEMVAFGGTLAARQHLLVQAAGSLRFASLPGLLPFESLTLPAGGTLVGRAEAGWQIAVEDTRENAPPWRLDAAIERPLAGQVGGGEVELPGALVYVDGDGNRTPLGPQPLTLFKSEGGGADIGWEDGQGPLLWLAPGAARSDVDYSTTIHWILSDAP